MSESAAGGVLARAPEQVRPPDPLRSPQPAPTRLPLAWATLLAGLCGWGLHLAFPPTGWWPIAIGCLGGLLLAVRDHSAGSAAWIGLVFGFMFFTPHLSWSGAYVGALPWAALVLSQSLFLAATGALLPWVWRAPLGVPGVTMAAAGLWTAAEALRSRLPFGGFPWGRLAFSQVDGPLAALAPLGGAPLVSAAVVAAGALTALTVVELVARNPRRALVRIGGLVLLVLAGTAIPVSATPSGRIPVAAVQGNVPRPGLDFNAERRAVLDNHALATITLGQWVRAGTAERPALVLWPENASDIDPLRNPDAAEVITRATDAVGVPVLVGAVLREPPGHLSNVAILWGPTGTPAAGPGERYVKRHPAPFAEYIPLRGFFRIFSDKVDLVRKDFVPGDRVGVFHTGPAVVGNLICFEVVYDNLVRDVVRAGSDLLVVQTNNATFGHSDESVQQLAASRLRALETGRSVVHISTVGISALIEPDGTLVRRSQHFQPEVLTASLPLNRHTTPAVRIGPWPEYLLVLSAAVLLVLAGHRDRLPFLRRLRIPARPRSSPHTPNPKGGATA